MNTFFEKNASGVTKYPLGIGISGEVYKTKKIFRSNVGKLEPIYNELIDNAANGPRPKNLLFLPLFSKDGSIIGILQLINKINGDVLASDEVLLIIDRIK